MTYTAGDRKHQVFYDYAKVMKIWRVPEVHLDTPEKYSDRGREYWQVWNREIPISEFVEREAPKYIQVRLHSHLVEVQRGREYWQVWNREVPISEFTQREAPTYIQVTDNGRTITITITDRNSFKVIL